MADPRHLLGLRAEEAAADWLNGRGWRILARRWRCPQGELDMVALDPAGTLVAIEVKLRRTGRAGSPLEGVDPRRLLRLRAALGRFATTIGSSSGSGLRIDLVALHPGDQGRWCLTHHRAIDAW